MTSANYLHRVQPLHQTRSFIIECINDYKTTSSKKSFLTREMKQLSGYISDLKEMAAKSSETTFWYHGEVFTSRMIAHYESELLLLESLKNGIN